MGGILSIFHGVPTFMVYLGCFIAALASAFWRPQIGVYYMAFFLPLQTLRYRLQDYPGGEKFADILLLGVVLGLLFHRGGTGWVRTPLTRLILIWGVFLYVSLWFGSAYLGKPWPLFLSDPRVSDWKNYIELPFLVLVTVGAIRDRREMKILLIVMALSFLVVNKNFYSTMSGRELDNFSYGVREAGVMGYAGVNGLAAFEATCMLFMVAMLGFKLSRYVKWALYGLLATGLYCLLFSFSRGGYVGFVVGLFFLGVVKQRRLLILVAVLLIGWQTLLPVSVQQRITMTYESDDGSGGLDSSAELRVELWKDAETIIKANPIFGTGFNTYFYMARMELLRDTHNYYLKVLLETGAVGLLFFMFILWRMLALGIRLFRRSDDPFLSSIGLGFAALMIGMVIVNIFGDRWSYLQVDSYMWFIMGMVIRGLMITEQEAAVKLPIAAVERTSMPTRPGRKLVPQLGVARGVGLVQSRLGNN